MTKMGHAGSPNAWLRLSMDDGRRYCWRLMIDGVRRVRVGCGKGSFLILLKELMLLYNLDNISRVQLVFFLILTVMVGPELMGFWSISSTRIISGSVTWSRT